MLGPAVAQTAETMDDGSLLAAPMSVPTTPPPPKPRAAETGGALRTVADANGPSYGSYKNQTPGSFAGTIVGNYSADSLIGRTIVDRDNTSVGKVQDLLIGSDGSIQNVLAEVGGFLGIDTKTVALNLKQIKLRDDASGDLQSSLTKDQIEALPRIEDVDGEWRTVPGSGRQPLP